MYEQHFGLTRRPFRAHATGTDVFVGPQSATMMAAIKKALATEDSAVAVSGPAGGGKSTIVKRALDGVGGTRLLVSIGRMQLGYDEVLELLLAGLGARQLPKSTVQRFALFRRLLQQHAEKNMRVIIVIEDAVRVGVTALSEIEALTAEDAGVSNGANVVLMGDSTLRELLRDPQLARLKQRVRLRQAVEPLSEKELLGYLKHHFRLAGGDFDALFAPGTATALHGLSGGVPRVVNGLIESALTSAAENNISTVPVDLIVRIAKEEFGITAEHSVAQIEQFVATAEKQNAIDEAASEPELPEPAVAVRAAERAAALPEPVSPTAADDESDAVQKPALPPEPAPSIAQPPAADDADIPELIQDTLPDLQILAPELANPSEPDEDDELPTLFSSTRLEEPPAPAPVDKVPEAPVAAPEPDVPETAAAVPAPEEAVTADVVVDEPAIEEPVFTETMAADTITEKTVAEIPQLEDSVSDETPQVEDAVSDEIPEWERDPTLAQLKPDLDALERAMAVAHGGETEPPPPVVVPEPEEPVPEIPQEITLDREIQAKIDEATEALKQTHFDIEVDDEQLASTPEAGDGNTEELKKIASGIAKARTLEDVDDKLAETLFGEEFSMIAAQVMAKAPPDFSANDDVELELAEPEAQAAPTPLDLEGAAALSVEPAPEPSDPHGNIDNSPSQRLKTVRDLNSGAAPAGAPLTPESTESIVMAVEPATPATGNNSNQPQSIEEQIDTSMTATLKALSIRPESIPDDDEEEEKKGGFFSRFRR